jgi:hypothetical protein
MKARMWLLAGVMLVPALCAYGAYMDAGALIVGSGDISLDQSDADHSGYDFRWKYDNWLQVYAKNQNGTGSPEFTGWTNGVYSQASLTRMSGSKCYIHPTAVDTVATAIFKFDLSGAGTGTNVIDQLIVRSYLLVGASYGSSGSWAVSTDGSNWTNYISFTGGAVGQSDDTYHDLTSYVQGSSVYWLKATLLAHDYNTNAQIFRTSGGSSFNFDNKVWLTPEPATMGILVAGSLAAILRRRRK